MANLRSFQLPPELSDSNDDHRHTQTRIRIRIPQQYHQEPVISNLITQHHLTVTITAALLGANAQGVAGLTCNCKGLSLKSGQHSFILMISI